jgi:flagellar biosynthesis protein FlhB
VSDKTEQATPRRQRKAREEGDSGASPYAAQALAFVAAVALAPAAIRSLAEHASDDLRTALARAASHEAALALRVDATAVALTVVALAAPLLLAVGIAAGAALAVQTGGVVASRRLTPRLERLNPIEGIKALFSATRLFAIARSLLAAAVVALLAWQALKGAIIDVARLAGRAQWTGIVAADVASSLAWRAALVGLALGAVDLLVTRQSWLRRLRMTKDEVRREHRDSEGDPQLKAARERAYHELLAQAAVANVRQASVVVVNPTHIACALRYDEEHGDEAPVVVASGEGDLAARIVKAAHDYGVPVVRDVPLARALVELSIGDAIPEALYEAVAEILRELMEEEGD